MGSYYDVTLLVTKAPGRVTRQPFKRIQAGSAQQAREKLFQAHHGLRNREEVMLEIRELNEDDSGKATFGDPKKFDSFTDPALREAAQKKAAKGKPKPKEPETI